MLRETIVNTKGSLVIVPFATSSTKNLYTCYFRNKASESLFVRHCLHILNCPGCEPLRSDTEVLTKEEDDDKQFILETPRITSLPHVMSEALIAFESSSRMLFWITFPCNY